MLKAGPLSRSLGVTRGSFYWHFQDIEQFHMELLERWKALATDNVIEEINQTLNKSDRLQSLLEKALNRHQKLERAIRSWATQNADAARVVAQVDKVRLDYLSEILQSPKVDETDLKLRAHFIYWAYLGHVMLESSEVKWDSTAIRKIAALFRS